MKETSNDQRVVKLVNEYRLLSQKHIETLTGKARSTVQQRLMRLYHHRYLDREFLPVSAGFSPTLYRLGRRGIELIRRLGDEPKTTSTRSLSPYFLAHTLAINEFRIAINQKAWEHRYSVSRWVGEGEIKANYDRVSVSSGQKNATLPVVPDSYFSLTAPGKPETSFFLELDRGTMTQKRFIHKVLAYVTYHKSGAFEQRYRKPSFRVLTVVDTSSRKRLKYLADASASVPGVGRKFWFAHLDDVTGKDIMVDKVWRIAGREALVSLWGR
jgi:hypothetical protein